MSLPLHLWRPLKPIGERSASSTSLVEPACLQLVRAARAFRKGVQARHVPANARSSHHREPVPRLAAVDDVISSACNGAPSRAELPLPSSSLHPHADTVQWCRTHIVHNSIHHASCHVHILTARMNRRALVQGHPRVGHLSSSRHTHHAHSHTRSHTHMPAHAPTHMHTHTDTHSL